MLTLALRGSLALSAVVAVLAVWLNPFAPPSTNAQPPLAKLRVLAPNQPVADEKVAVSKSLTEDGRIGKVSDAQGIVVLRPMLARRWTPVCRETLLRPGDWLRTELRGANAVKVTLSSEVELTLGPGTLVECISPTEARLHSGEVQVMFPNRKVVEESVAFQLLAPRDGKRVFKHGEKKLVRVNRDEKIVDVPQTPVWLAGFEGTTNNESLGSLIVNLPDGRHEPLSVGYHKVSVEIRDQIARTTIEESFVNHTDARLEGIFHFPLPQDASISGFGMWIGNDLVEADVVEKQRAREIFETILREKRDPGLLEWMGGNLFKARVFPIEARSEKRIKIVYTQVLPLRANRYRYSYGLRSELLRTKPLRELSLTVTVNSALPLKSVTCPTHTVRALQTGHSAQVEFAAQEYTPTRDFEVVCEVDGKQSDVVVIPHRRGDDGYFLIQLTPPAADGNWQRELLPDGKPLHVVLLCDTSSSMDSEKRKQQAEFVATVLSSLGADDRFLLGACDVGVEWFVPVPSPPSSGERARVRGPGGEPTPEDSSKPKAKPEEKPPHPNPLPQSRGRGDKAEDAGLAPTAENIAKARAFLEERISLGWTNLDRAFADVIQKSPADAHVIYIGDGIVSAGSTDPAAFVQRLGVLLGRRTGTNKDLQPTAGQPTAVSRSFHSVTVGNVSESVVLKGIATVGGGSVRSIGNEQTPQLVALELLNEIAQPGLRELNVEFRGLKVAAVYPGQLPNVAAGTQQILVGRYLPEGKDQSGEIVVTGLRGTEKVKYSARVNLKDAEEGNSFIPRLWARAHLDQLLAQGQSAQIREDIIGLSEQFHIITPYTSLLVLESDADRERFGVKRRYEMRDGERFFAEGRNNANFELAQAQMKRAGNWRLGLRRQFLGSLKNLGRDEQALQATLQMIATSPYYANAAWGLPMGGRSSGRFGAPMSYGGMGGMGGGMGGGGGGMMGGMGGGGLPKAYYLDDEVFALGDTMHDLSLEILQTQTIVESDGEPGEDESLSLGVADADQPADGTNMDFDTDGAMPSYLPTEGLMAEKALGGLNFGRLNQSASFFFKTPARYRDRGSNEERGDYGGEVVDYFTWFHKLFPALAPATKPTVPAVAPETWSAEAIAVAKSLLRTESLRKFDGGIELKRVVDQLDPRWNRRSSRRTDLVLYSPTGWLTRPLNRNEQTIVNYATPQERGVYSLAFLLGRQRAAVETDLTPEPLALDDFSLSPLHEQYSDRIARVEAAEDNLVKLILTPKQSPPQIFGNSPYTETFLIDTARHVVLKHEWIEDGRVTGTVTFDNFIELAGSWWARKSFHFDAEGLQTSETTFDIKALTKAQHVERMGAELAAKSSVQFIQLPFIKLSVARQKSADGAATFDHRLAMILHNARHQQWDEMWKHVDAAEAQADNKPGIRWIRTILLATIRRNEEANARLLKETTTLVATPQQEDLFLAGFLLDEALGVNSSTEFAEVIKALKPVYERQPADVEAMSTWMERLADVHGRAGHHEQALALRRSLAESAPWNVHAQLPYARLLSQAGQHDAAHAWLRQELDRPVNRHEQEDYLLRNQIIDLFRAQARWTDLLAFTTDWIGRKPHMTTTNSAYAQHLSALVMNDQLDQANALAQQWLNDARIEGKLAPVPRARFDAALHFAQGNAYNLSSHRIEERWHELLGELVRFFVRHPHHAEIAARIMAHHQFQQIEVADQLRGEFLALLRTDLAKLSPGQINTLVGWTLTGRIELPKPVDGRRQLDASEIAAEVWKQIASALKLRWEQAEVTADKQTLGDALVAIHTARFREELLLPFLRERVAGASPEYTLDAISKLFEELLTAKWTLEIEQEAFARLRELSDAVKPLDRLPAQLPALYRLVDAMSANRRAADEQALNDKGGLDKLTRRELAAKKDEIRRTARSELSARLAAEAKKEDGPLADWLKIEQTWLDVQLGQNLPPVVQFCWQLLGDAPPQPLADADPDDSDDEISAIVEPQSQMPEVDDVAAKKSLEAILKQRALTTVMSLAIRRAAKPDEADRVLKFIDAGIAQEVAAAPKPEPAKPQDAAKPQDGAKPAVVAKVDNHGSVWRNAKYRMLVVLDRPDDLDRALRQWIRDDVSTAPWRQSLARLVAERGKLDEAIQLLEACQKDKLLSAGDFKMLADWYLVVDRRAAYESSRLEAYKQLPEEHLRNLLHQASNVWQPQEVFPAELDESTLFALQALFEKTAHPEHYLSHVRTVYAGSRDFRLLQMLPDAVLGRSPQQVYAFLHQLNGTVLHELRNEAAADEILARIKTLRGGERTVTDLRALDLLEALVERKSSEVLDQPGPHMDACLAALQRAFAREWGPGEPPMMSNFLAQLGQLPPKLAEEQLREVRALQKVAPAHSRDHLTITSHLCQLIGPTYRRPDEAIREMEPEVRSYSQAHNGNWPHLDNGVLGGFIALYEQAGQHAAGEVVLQRFLSKPEHAEQRKWLDDRLMALYINALEANAAVSLGAGRAKLLEPLYKLHLKHLDESLDENERHNLVGRLVTMFDIAHNHKIAGASELIQNFAFDVVPVLLKRQTAHYRGTATLPMRPLASLAGPKLALRYVVERMEQYPQRLQFSWESAWQNFGHELASQRAATGPSDLDGRVFALAIQELQRELRTGENRGHHIFHHNHSYFWKEKAGDFAKVAEAVLTERKSSGRRVAAIAQYFWHGLNRPDRAIEILFVAHKQGLLDENTQVQLISWLNEKSRFAESIPLLETLVSAHRDNMHYRTWLMTAYFRSQRPEQLAELIRLTDEYFHDGGRWTEENVAALGQACMECEQPERAVAYLTEAIVLHQRANPGSGLNDSELAHFYSNLAHANSALGRTKEAVDAASAAIVCWGARSEERTQHLDTLNYVLNSTEDLDAYVAHLDAETAKTGQDSPILRKAIGLTHKGRDEHAKAITQLRLAVDLQPYDAETHRALIECYDATENTAAATRQLLKLIDLHRHDLTLYQQLAERLRDNEVEAERAATSIIEASPGEAENHAVMAELRQSQERWGEAIPHWEQVAELRKLEPNGLLKLAEAQLHEQQWDAARSTVNKLRKTEWAARFTDVQDQTNQLEARIPKK